jgi:hypothetical protein
MKGGGDRIGDDGGFRKRNSFGQRREVEGGGTHIFGITAVAGHAYIPSPVLTKGLPSAPAEAADLAREIKMTNHPIPGFNIAYFTADVDNFPCDFMA